MTTTRQERVIVVKSDRGERRGVAMPPIEVYRVGGLGFVSDSHHRVSIAAATARQTIEANVTEILAAVPPEDGGEKDQRAVAAEQQPPALPFGDDFRRESAPPLRPTGSFFS
jgi:hypothetical protein